MSSGITLTYNDGLASDAITINRGAKYVHLESLSGDTVSIPRELLPAFVATLQRELKDE